MLERKEELSELVDPGQIPRRPRPAALAARPRELAASTPPQLSTFAEQVWALPASAITAAPPPNTPTWTGPLRITSSGIDLSVQPPSVVSDSSPNRITVAYDGGHQTLAVGFTGLEGPAAVWPAATVPTYEQCLAQVQTQPLSSIEQQAIPYRQGQGLCIVTYQRVALAFVRGISAPGPKAVQMQGIRWPISQ